MQDTRKIESSPNTVTIQTNTGVFETVSRMLTIRNATKSDSGIYVCNVTDFSGRTYSVSKYIDIKNDLFEDQSILNSGSINFSHRNLLFTFISFFYVYYYSRY